MTVFAQTHAETKSAFVIFGNARRTKMSRRAEVEARAEGRFEKSRSLTLIPLPTLLPTLGAIEISGGEDAREPTRSRNE